MPSIRAKLVNRYIRSTFKPLPLADMEPEKLRALVEAKPLPFQPKEVEIEKVNGAVDGEWHRPPTPDSNRVILYLHGGGYVFGSARTHRSLTRPLAKLAGLSVFSQNYRLTPEHTCPAAIEDARVGWDWLRATGYDAANIFVGGDSAGGGLTLALLQNLRDSGEAMPGGAFLYSPWTDLTCSGQSHDEIGNGDAMFTPETIRRGGPRYAGDLPLTDPRVSPLYGDMSGLPPMIVFASRDELLRDDTTRLVEKARAAGVEIEAHFEDGLVHVWPLFSPIMPEGKTALRKTADFIKRH